VLAIGIKGDDEIRSETQGSANPCSQRPTQPPVQDMSEPNGPLARGKLTSAVAAAVIDDEERCETALLEPPNNVDNGPLFIVGGDDDDHVLTRHGHSPTVVSRRA
jgi:hypothetical protein